jgi:hypothetical protein
MKSGFKKKALIFLFGAFLFIPFSFLVFGFSNNMNNHPIFQPSAEINLSNLTPIDYASLNNSWYHYPIDMIIIAPNDTDFLNALQPLSQWKNEKGVKTVILSNFSAYDGIDTAEKIRNMIKEYHNTYDTKWVLLAGDTDKIPIRYVFNPDVLDVVPPQTEYSSFSDYYKPTDFYYSSLEGTWDEDNDGNYGESAIYNANGIDEISWIPDVYVGRFPASDAKELAIMVNKSLNYEKDPDVGLWMNNMLLAGGISSYNPPEDEARLTEYIWQHYVINEMNFTHLTRTTASFTPTIPPLPNQIGILTHDSFRDSLNAGYAAIIIAGHADPTIINDASGTTFYRDADALNTLNYGMPSLIYADACTTSSYDQGDDSIGERLIKQNNSGAIGYIGGLRVTWYLDDDTNLEKLNRGNAKLFWQQFFEEKKFQQGRALYDSKVAYLNSDYFKRGVTSIDYEYQRKNVLSYNLLGDPELDVYTNISAPIPNYLNTTIFAGQLIELNIKDLYGRNTSNVRMNFRSADGKYFTAYSDNSGGIKVRLPPHINEKYNVTVTGHNITPIQFNFTTIQDTTPPELINISSNPKHPSISDNIQFDIKAIDNQSGLESAFVLLTSNDFNDYECFQARNNFTQNRENFDISLNKLKPGDYSFSIVLRDYNNNTMIYSNASFRFSILASIIDGTMIVAILMTAALSCIAIISTKKGFEKLRE